MKHFLSKAMRFIRNHDYVIERDYDNACAVYSPKDTETPAFSYAFQGGFRLSLSQIVALISGAASVILFLSSFGGKKKKKK